MRAPRAIVLSLVAAAALVLSLSASSTVAEAQGSDKADAAAPSLPACIAVATEARYVPFGYNHIVAVKNGCSKAASCIVMTDVSPQAIPVDVPSSSRVEVLTFMASPAQTFHARVTCKLH